MSDCAIRRLTTATVLLVATIAAVVSYQHLYHLAITHGETRLDATLLPLSIDGTVVTASLVMLRAARLGLGTPWLARCLLAAAVAMTVAANVAFGWQYAAWGVLMAGWPAAAFLGNAEATISFGRKANRQRGDEGSLPGDSDGSTAVTAPEPLTESTAQPLTVTTHQPLTESAAESGNGTRPERANGRTANRSPARSRRAPQRRSRTAPVTAEEVHREFMAEIASGAVPSLRQIRSRCHVGPDRAKALREQLEGMVSATN